jgi:predicted cation transporter
MTPEEVKKLDQELSEEALDRRLEKVSELAVNLGASLVPIIQNYMAAIGVTKEEEFIFWYGLVQGIGPADKAAEEIAATMTEEIQ